MTKKLRLTKKQVVTGVVVVVVIAAAAGFGMLAQMLQRQGGGETEEQIAAKNKLPALITEVQDLQTSGKTDEAKKKIDEALNNGQTDNNMKYMLYIQKGNALLNNGDTQGGIDQYLKAYEVSATYEVTRLLAESYQEIGDKAKAIEFYKKAYALIPEGNSSPLAEQDRETISKIITSLGGTL